MPTSVDELSVSRDRVGRNFAWANLVVAALAMVGTLPGRTQGLGLITEALIADTGMDRVTYATLNLWATLIGAAFCLPCGRLLDRFGSRILLTVIVAGLGLVTYSMSRATTLPGLAVCITLTRGLGQSALSVASLALVGKWFGRRLNFAMGVYSLLVGIGFVAAFPSVGQANLAYGWRTAWGSTGLALLLGLGPLAWLVVRRGPEAVGAVFDGHSQTQGRSSADLTFGEALRAPAFWVFALASAMFGLVYSGIALFNQSILEQRGFDATTYHTVLVISTLVGLLANFGGGWLASFWPIQRLMGIGMAVLALSLLMLPVVQSFAQLVVYAVLMGLSGGVVTVVFFSVWGQVFGRTDLGRIQGCAQMMTVVASAVGPWLLARTLERTGSYESVFLGLAAWVVVLGLASWFVNLPGRASLLADSEVT